MYEQVDDILQRVSPICPDDGGNLSRHHDRLVCGTCDRCFPILAERVIDLLPRAPSVRDDFRQEYADSYLSTFSESLLLEDTPAPWADPDAIGSAAVIRKLHHVAWVLSLLEVGSSDGNHMLCDVTGGPGYYTLALAPHFKYVLHCDLSGLALSHVFHRAKERHLSNVFFVRLDYLRLPFRRTLDRVLCLDTLIRGASHEAALIPQISDSLAPNGLAVMDFHNWWHNPLRRMGLLPDNFVGNRSYSRASVESLLQSVAVTGKILPFYAEGERNKVLGYLAPKLLPCTRHTVLVRGRHSSAKTTDVDAVEFPGTILIAE